MSMSRELFLAILAMDSYDKGYNQRLKVDGTQLGLATVGTAADTDISQPYGFFAQAYTINGGVDGIAAGTTVISYRGTDDPLGSISGSDLVYGWTTAAGYIGPGSQAGLAFQFYQDVSHQSILDGADPNVILTGHSLGGGLAGLVSSITGTSATLFDHSPFSWAAVLAYLGILGDGGTVAPPTYSQISATYVTGEALQIGRAVGPAALLALIALANPAAAVALAGYTVFAESSLNYDPLSSYGGQRNPVDLHSQSLLVSLLYARDGEANGSITTDWHQIAPQLINSLFDDSVAKAVGFVTDNATGTGLANAADKMLKAIDYTAIDAGYMPYGNAAIVSLFADADKLGQVFKSSSINPLLSFFPLLSGNAVLQDLASAVAQYAGDLALAQSTSADAKKGVFTLSTDGSDLKAEFKPDDWNSTYHTDNGTKTRLPAISSG